MRGITCIAIGLSEEGAVYGKFAYNLALTLRYHSPGVPIQLLCNAEGILHLTDKHLEIFDDVTEINRSHYIEGKYMPAKAKIWMYDYLKYDETVYLDADTIIIKDIAPLFDECKDDYYTTIVALADDKVSNFREMQWCEIGYLREHFGLNGNTIPATNSSFQFIRKGEITERLFRQMQDNFAHRVPDDKLGLTWGSGKQPDELYLNVALAQLNMIPRLENEPVCYKVNEALDVAEDYEKHYALSFYGGKGFTHGSLVRQYDLEIRKISREQGYGQEFKINSLMKHKYVDTK